MAGTPEPTTWIVVTADQRDSRTQADAVPDALDLLAAVATVGSFERTAGDEVQGLLAGGDQLAPAVEALLRDGRWSIGIGIGPVEHPVPQDPREGRGHAFVAAREAVEAAKSAPGRIRVTGPSPEARHLESALWLWAALLARRTQKGWEVVDLVDRGLSYETAGEQLGITQSAVSQRAAAAGLAEGRRARELVSALAVRTLTVGADRQDG